MTIKNESQKQHEHSSNFFETLPDSALLEPSKAAEFLGLTGHTLSIWRSTGRYALPYCKVGRMIRYRVGDLKNFIESRMRTKTGEKGL